MHVDQQSLLVFNSFSFLIILLYVGPVFYRKPSYSFFKKQLKIWPSSMALAKEGAMKKWRGMNSSPPKFHALPEDHT